MENDTIFGYGSLVNSATHDYGDLQMATLRGWRREWRFTSLRDLAYLSAAPDADSVISGVVLSAPAADQALANREAAYDRAEISRQISPKTAGDNLVHIYYIPLQVHQLRGPNSALLLSYIDVVVQGYYRMSGEDGVQMFFETTKGWGAKVINDRSAPVYPRHQQLDRHETALTDHWLGELATEME